jgi:hypothetical protein
MTEEFDEYIVEVRKNGAGQNLGAGLSNLYYLATQSPFYGDVSKDGGLMLNEDGFFLLSRLLAEATDFTEECS